MDERYVFLANGAYTGNKFVILSPGNRQGHLTRNMENYLEELICQKYRLSGF